MTESELDIIRLKLRQEVLLILIRGLYTGLANSSPSAAQEFRGRFASLRADHQKIVLKGTDPANSDMISAEYQEALEDYLSNIESGFKF